jgi:glutamyl-Q tRNA(Asp) synthetase
MAGAGWCASRTSTRRAACRADATILRSWRCGLAADEPPVWQSQRGALYEAALQRCWRDLAYPAAARAEIELALQARASRTAHAELSTRHLPRRPARQAARATRATAIEGHDVRIAGRPPAGRAAAGRRARGRRLRAAARRRLWAYQLAVVVDDAEQGVTHVVRGEDLADNTERQILLQRALQLPTPRFCTRRWCSAPTATS